MTYHQVDGMRLDGGQVTALQLFVRFAEMGKQICEPIPVSLVGRDSQICEHLTQQSLPVDYQIRAARDSDLPALLELERLCWTDTTQTSAQQIQARISRYPVGQRVMVYEGDVVGVIYTQRIDDVTKLDGMTQYTVDTLHRPAGSIAQLLAINLDPVHQHRGWGDALLEHILTFYRLHADIGHAVALTRCKRFDRAAGLSMTQYIEMRSATGFLADPVLRFHELHGAQMVKPVSNYRPGDFANDGYGILVQYDLKTRQRQEAGGASRSPGPTVGFEWLRLSVAQALDCDAEQIDIDMPLMDLGLDSADLLVLKETIRSQTGVPVSAAFLFEHNTITRLMKALSTQLPPMEKVKPAKITRGGHEPIAIVGLACRLPGGVECAQDFWDLLQDERVVIGELPGNRWQWPDSISPQSTHRGIDRGGFLTDIAAFDAGFFHVSPVEAQSMDPQQRLLLTLSWEVMEHAGYDPLAMQGSNIGVFVGASGSDYARLGGESVSLDAHFGTGSSMAVLANRLSQFYDLQGPSLVIDTACSSSLVAVHEAIQSIRQGESEQALVAGVNILCHPANSMAYYKAGMLSQDGLCRTFDARANGYVRSEGAVMMWLKPLEQAQRDKDHIYATLLGSASHHGGQASGLTVPKPDGQAQLLKKAWSDAGVEPEHIQYIETHGTGTRLGDPIEVEGIARARGQSPDLPGCLLGAVKTNVGHLEAAAGITGLLKAILVMEHQSLPANPGFEALNPELTLSHGLRVTWSEEQPSDQGLRIAGVSSFGSGGTNAHVVVAAQTAEQRPEVTACGDGSISDEPVTLILSARSEQALQLIARRYVDWLERDQAQALPLPQIAWQLRHGRRLFEHKLTCQAQTHQQWQEQLRTFVAHGTHPLMNAPVPVKATSSPPTCQRCALPTYPFEPKRFWVPGKSVPLSLEQQDLRAGVYGPVWTRSEPALDVLDPGAVCIHIGQAPSELSDGIDTNRLIVITPSMDEAEITQRITQSHAKTFVVLFSAKPDDTDRLAACTHLVLKQGFEVIQGLMRVGSRLSLTVITEGAFARFDGQKVNPIASGLQGLFSVLGNEQPDWRVRCLDLTVGCRRPTWNESWLPDTDTHEPLVWCGRLWWSRRFVPVQAADIDRSVFRYGGVYVLIGGAGGVGGELTRVLLRRYNCRVVWIGRQRCNDEIAQRMTEHAAQGRLTYIRADATDLSQLDGAVRQVREQVGKIDGLMQLAIGPSDQPLSQGHWRLVESVLRSKIDVSVNLLRVAKSIEPDFVLMCSSVISLEMPGGYAGYAAGGAFQDALAWLACERFSFKVKVINWGHWKVGTATTLALATRRRLARQGVRPIGANDAMRAIELVLHAHLPQLACLAHRCLEQVRWINVQHQSKLLLPTSGMIRPHGITTISSGTDVLAALSADVIFGNSKLDAIIKPVLASLLDGLDPTSIEPNYTKWYEAAHRWLAEQPLGTVPESAWKTWHQGTAELLATAPDLAGAIELAHASLSALPNVLTGKRRATDVLFPQASMALVQRVYQDNPVSDHFNAIVAQVLQQCFRSRCSSETEPVNLIEIGAGTGGTTSVVLPALMDVSGDIGEYLFTDVSKAFLFHAQQRFGQQCGFLKTGILDITQNPQAHGIRTHQYDVAIATNVLHATPDLEQTLMNVKRLLKPGGILVLNEISTNSLFAHVTFGLLEGWWLTKDADRRLPDSPLLDTERWQTLLQICGFIHCRVVSPDSARLGQQVLVAQSDGMSSATELVFNASKGEVTELSKPSPMRSGTAEGHVRPSRIATLARDVFADVLRMPSQDISMREPLKSYGLDSILIVQITARLRQWVPDVSSTLLFECQTLQEVVQALSKDAVEQEPTLTNQPLSSASPALEPAASVSTDQADQQQKAEPIAIIGMALRLPEAESPKAFWELLSQGCSAVGDVPVDRWSQVDFYEPDPDAAIAQGKSYCRFGAFLSDVTAFDPQFFNISPKEAVAMDPQERLFLQTSWHALENAGYSRDRLLASTSGRVGVYAGITRTGFDLFGPLLWDKQQRIYPHTSFSSVANRLSYFLNVHGPSMPVDTMCSSSLTAIHQACQGLRAGECEAAIVGGVNLYLHPSSYVSLSAMRMLSPDGVCRAFGQSANGFVPGEGVVVMVLKPLSRALADGDYVQAVIRATGVNHGGRTNGYTVPNPNAQADLVRQALDQAGINARDVSYIEAHGTGTALGDPIEMTGLTKAFRADTQDTGYCRVGSVKSNIGHLEAAAGIAGVAKVVLQLQHRQLVPSLHTKHLNPAIDFKSTPFEVQTELSDWRCPLEDRQQATQTGGRLAGVSSFGAGGANAHAILQDFTSQPTVSESVTPGPLPIILSARTQVQLRQMALALSREIKEQSKAGTLDLAGCAYTLQVGRQPMEVRVAFVANDLTEVVDTLDAIAQQKQPAMPLHQGKTREHRDVIEALDESVMQVSARQWCESGQFDRLLTLWVKGLNFAWWALYDKPGGVWARPMVAHLPGYPFEKVRCWFSDDVLERNEVALKPTRVSLPESAPADVAVTSEHTALRRASHSPLTLRNPALKLTREGWRAQAAVSSSKRQVINLKIPGSSVGKPLWSVKSLPEGVYELQPGDQALIQLDRLVTGLIHTMQQLTRSGVEHTAVLRILWPAGVPIPADLTQIEQLADQFRQLNGVSIVQLGGKVDETALRVAAAADLAITVGDPMLDDSIMSDASLLEQAKRRFGDPATGKLGLPFVDRDEAQRFIDQWVSALGQAEPRSVQLLLQRLREQRQWAIDQASLLPWPAVELKCKGSLPLTRDAFSPVTIESQVVSLSASATGVWLIELHDETAKNTSSTELVNGLTQAFDLVNESTQCRVVVVTGYDSYFACGGTREGLLAIQAGQSRFTDEQTYSRPLYCEVPVIAAMQGHGIGAGWALGLYADITLYARQAHYQAPYMRYGFTPGAGSTAIFGQRLGFDLALCVLMSAQRYRADELVTLGLTDPVLGSDKVLDHAFLLASSLATKDRGDLVELKTARVGHLRAQLPEVYDKELALHDQTFVGQSHVIERVQRHFVQAHQLSNSSVHQVVSAVRDSGPGARAMLLEELRKSLAEELLLTPSDIDGKAAFIDLGLDSIVAVTWVKSINQRFLTNLLATDVYSYPDLNSLAEHLSTQVSVPPRQDTLTPMQDETITLGDASVPMLADTETRQHDAQSRAKKDESRAELQDVGQALQQLLADELFLAAQDIELDAPFVELGLDSIVAVTWIQKINRKFGLNLNATDVYSFPNVSELAAHVIRLGPAGTIQADQGVHGRQPPPIAPTVSSVRSEPSPSASVKVQLPPAANTSVSDELLDRASVTAPKDASSTLIAIVGMAGRFPKADSIKDFWDNILQKRDCVDDIPAMLWDIDEYYSANRTDPGKTVCRRMGFLEDRDVFDPLFFNISPSEAELMDPQQRLFLQSSLHCIEDAGYDPTSFAGQRCGVFVGCAVSDYHQAVMPQDSLASHALIGESVSMLPARVSYFLDLHGPCMATDTACSSSLVAFANACDSLVSGQSDTALAGGVYLINGPDIQVKMSQAGMLSPDGACFAFDERANGFVPGEGVGVVLLKRFDDAQRDGDDIYAVVKGWGVNQDGKTNGITAPNRFAQARLERDVYDRFKIDPETIGLIEAHGTGTKLGDPIEVQALCDAFSAYTDKQGFCALGSVKSNVGHLATAAGITGIIKAALAIRHAIKPGTIQHQKLNPHIELANTPFYVCQDNEPWLTEPGQSRLATVSSFGFSGTNAHVVLAAPVKEVKANVSPPMSPVIVPVSAQTADQLQVAVSNLLRWLQSEGQRDDIDLADVAFTLGQGRQHFGRRAAFVVKTADALVAALQDWLKQDESQRTSVCGLSGSDLGELANDWVSGRRQDMGQWLSLGHPPGKRLAGLPGYPFAQERYWLGGELTTAAAMARVPEVGLSWAVSPLPEDFDWKVALNQLAGKTIQLAGSDQQLIDAVLALGKQLSGQLAVLNSVHIELVSASFDNAKSETIHLSVVPADRRQAALPLLLGRIGTRASADITAWHQRVSETRHLGLISFDPDLTFQQIAQSIWRELLLLAQGGDGQAHVHLSATQRWVWHNQQTESFEQANDQSMSRIVKVWRHQPLNAQIQPVVEGTVLVMVNKESVRLGQLLRDAQIFRRTVLVADESVPAGSIQNVMPLDDPASAKISARILVDQYADFVGLIDLSDLSTQPTVKDTSPAARAVLYQTLIATCKQLQIIHVTRGLHAEAAATQSVKGAYIAPLVAMLGAEYPYVTAKTIDGDESALVDLHDTIELIRSELLDQQGYSSVLYKNGQRYVPDFKVMPLMQPQADARLSSEDLYLVTGGTRGVGLALAKHLVAKGCRNLMLVGLSDLPPQSKWADSMATNALPVALGERLQDLQALRELVSNLYVVSVDLSDKQAFAKALAPLVAKHGAVRGVIHAAAQYPNRAKPGFVSKSVDTMVPVWQAKVTGFETLVDVLADSPPDFFVSVTSASAMFVPLGKGASDYVMANSALATYTQHWQLHWPQTKFLALCWPDWTDVGALTRLPQTIVQHIENTFRRLGMSLLRTPEGHALFERALVSESPVFQCVSQLDQAVFEAAKQQMVQPGAIMANADGDQTDLTSERTLDITVYVDRWEAQQRAGDEITAEIVSSVISPADLANLPATLVHRVHRLLFAKKSTNVEHHGDDHLKDTIRDTVMTVLKLKAMDDARPLQDYGLDSISAMLLATRLEKQINLKVMPQWFIDHPSVDQISAFIRDQIPSSSGREASGV